MANLPIRAVKKLFIVVEYLITKTADPSLV
jgi:hypothetical protein